MSYSVGQVHKYSVNLYQQLEEETGTDIGLWNEGILQVAMTESEVADLKDTVAWRRQSGFTVDWLSVDELREIAPGIGPDALGAAFAPEDGALDPMALRWALLESAKQRYGATFLQEGAHLLREVATCTENNQCSS